MSDRREGKGPFRALAANEAIVNRLLLRESEIQEISERNDVSELAVEGLREELLQAAERFRAFLVDCNRFDVVE